MIKFIISKLYFSKKNEFKPFIKNLKKLKPFEYNLSQQMLYGTEKTGDLRPICKIRNGTKDDITAETITYILNKVL